MIKVWDVSQDKLECFRVLKGHTKGVRCVNLSTSGARFASGSEDHDVRVWSISQEKCWHVFSGHKDIVSAVALDKEND